MFGHQNDVISQDQRADASVPLPEETIDALTAAPPAGSQTDNHDPVTTAPPAGVPNETQTVDPTVVTPASPPEPPQPSQSLDGVITPQPSSMTFPTVSPAQSLSQSPFASYAPAQDSNSATDSPEPDNAQQEADSQPEVHEVEQSTPPDEQQTPETTEASINETPSDSGPQHVKVKPHPDELLKIKQEALSSLSPLVGKLEVSPEEKFRTIMMLIQASDDPTHLGEAYELAQSLEDEKARAQALLDVINEINYFTQKDKQA